MQFTTRENNGRYLAFIQRSYYSVSMLKNLRKSFSVWKDWYHTHQKKITLAVNIKIKNKNLYEELETACETQHGVLTYAEYLAIDQFGKYGFYATSTKHGKTDIHF